MTDHYTDTDRARTAPLKWRARDYLLDAGWHDMDDVAQHLGCRVGTLLSKMREFNDYHHTQHGLVFERRTAGKGRHEYRLFIRRPEQLTLLEGMNANHTV
jgi:hypothetical protein